jgi:hypothetical protein
VGVIVVTMVVVVVVAMIVAAVVMAVTMILAVPVSFVEAPSLLVMVIMRMAPIGASVRRPVPTSGNPYVLAVSGAPISVDPGISFARGRGSSLITHWWRISADIHADLRKSRHCEHCCNRTCTH